MYKKLILPPIKDKPIQNPLMHHLNCQEVVQLEMKKQLKLLSKSQSDVENDERAGGKEKKESEQYHKKN